MWGLILIVLLLYSIWLVVIRLQLEHCFITILKVVLLQSDQLITIICNLWVAIHIAFQHGNSLFHLVFR